MLPDVPFGFLARPRLDERFLNAFRRQIILVSAPAGYGKTTFLAYELSKISSPVAWVSLDARDDGLDEFWHEVIMAVDKISPNFADGFRSAFARETGFSRSDLTQFVNALLAKVPDICIVFDDFQQIASTEVCESVDYLMRYLPPKAHLVIASRVRPELASINHMFGNGSLAEITSSNLTFTLPETMSFYNEILGMSLSPVSIDHIDQRLGGWIAGLRMVEVALQNGVDIERVLSTDASPEQDIVDYLVNEIIDQQEELIQEFMVKTSVFDRFSAPLCDQALERDDSQGLIGRIFSRNLFLQAEENPGWYHYTPFFRQCLEGVARGIPTEEMHQVHARASRWFASNDMLELALEHALDAGEYDQVVELLNQGYVKMMGQDESAKMQALIRRLPEGIVRKSVWVNIGGAVACEMKRSYDQQEKYIQDALSLATDEYLIGSKGKPYHDTLVASLFILRMLEAYHHGSVEEAIELGQQGLAQMPGNELYGRCGILCVMGLSYWSLGQFDQARDCWQEGANLSLYIDWPYSICLDLDGVAHVHLIRNQMDSTIETGHRISAISGKNDKPVLSSCYAHLIMARVLYLRGELDDACDEIDRAFEVGVDEQEQALIMNCQMARAYVEAARGETEQAAGRANGCQTDFAAAYHQQWFEDADVMMAQLWLQMGKPEIAVDFLARFRDFDLEDVPDEETLDKITAREVFGGDFRNIWRDAPLLVYIRYRLMTGQEQGTGKWLGLIRDRAGKRGAGLIVVETLALDALRAYQEGQTDAAFASLSQALMLAEQSRCVRVFVDEGARMEELLLLAKRKRLASRFVEEILRQFHLDAAGRLDLEADFGETFTNREQEIMKLLCSGATNDEISKALYLSLATIKNYIHSIYMKLGVRNRAEAIVRMQELGFVDIFKR